MYCLINLCRFFVIANAIVAGYLLLSLPFSIICIIRPYATAPRLLLVIFDTVNYSYLYLLSPKSLAFACRAVTVIYKNIPGLIVAGDGGSNYSFSFSFCFYCVFGSLWKPQHKLACYLPAVWRLLPECKWSCGGFLHSRSHPHGHNRALRFCSQTKLRNKTAKETKVLNYSSHVAYCTALLLKFEKILFLYPLACESFVVSNHRGGSY